MQQNHVGSPSVTGLRSRCRGHESWPRSGGQIHLAAAVQRKLNRLPLREGGDCAVRRGVSGPRNGAAIRLEFRRIPDRATAPERDDRDRLICSGGGGKTRSGNARRIDISGGIQQDRLRSEEDTSVLQSRQYL